MDSVQCPGLFVSPPHGRVRAGRSGEQPWTAAKQPWTAAEQPWTAAEQPCTAAEQPCTAAEQPGTTAEQLAGRQLNNLLGQIFAGP